MKQSAILDPADPATSSSPKTKSEAGEPPSAPVPEAMDIDKVGEQASTAAVKTDDAAVTAPPAAAGVV